MTRSRRLEFASAFTASVALLGIPPTVAHGATDADRQLLAQVAAQVYADVAHSAGPIDGYPEAFVLAKPGPRWAWPPLVAISADTEVNAFATVRFVKPGEKPILLGEPGVVWVDVPGHESNLDPDTSEEDPAIAAALEDQPDGTIVQPVMLYKQGYLDAIVKGQAGPLAGCFGHELAHHLLKHTLLYPTGTPLVTYAATRGQEADADALGTALVLRAKFDYDAIVAGAKLEREGGVNCSFLGSRSTHPGWNDRLALIDARQRDKWRSIDAFDNGVHFLVTEQYMLAEKCFEEVIRKESKCYEAWANKGYAELMQFCDGLDPDDLRDYDLGQLVVGAFYSRPESLGLRAFDDELWFAAVGDLRQALILKPDLVMAKANLAVAWLLCPEGRQSGKAEQLFQEVNNALKKGHYDEVIDPLVRASLLVNAGVAENANGDPAAAETLFEEARELIASTSDSGQAVGVINAIRFNRARMQAARSEPEAQKSAIGELESYLASTSPAATWWTLAHEEYEKLCRSAGVEPKPQGDLADQRNTQFRPVAGVVMPDGFAVTLNEPVQPLEEFLGEDLRQVLIERSNVHRRRYAKHGLDLLCTSKIVAIRLQGASAPPLVLEATGPSEQSCKLLPGMTVDELDAALGGDATDWDLRYGASSAVVYRFYSRLGFGARVSDEGRVVELIVAQIPHAAVVGDN